MSGFAIGMIIGSLLVAICCLGCGAHFGELARTSGQGLERAKQYLNAAYLQLSGSPMMSAIYAASFIVLIAMADQEKNRGGLSAVDGMCAVIGMIIMVVAAGWADMFVHDAIFDAEEAAREEARDVARIEW